MSGEEIGVRERVLAAAVACAQRSGVSGFSLEDVAAEAGLSRTTIYRYFPDGRSQVFEEAVNWEIGRFWGRLAEAVAPLDTLEDRLVAGLVIGRKLMMKSSIIANLRDPELLDLVEAAQPSEPIVHEVIRDYMLEQLRVEQARGNVLPEVDLDFAADYLMRMALSWMSNPAGLDLTSDATARRIVRQQFLAGVLAGARS